MSTATDIVVCQEEGCDRGVMKPGSTAFGQGKLCEAHWRARREAGKERARAGETAPKRKASRARTEKEDSTPRVKRPSPLAGRIESALGTLGLGLSMVNSADGRAVLLGAHDLAVALDALAKENATVRRTLERALAGGAWGGVIIATAAIVMPIAQNHGMLSPVPFVQPPTVSPAPDTPPRPNGSTPTHDEVTGFARAPGM